MFVDCPHCHTAVMPLKDGCCPACRKNMQDTTGTDPNLAYVSIFEGESMPALCARCAATTDAGGGPLLKEAAEGDRGQAAVSFFTNLLGIISGLLTGVLFWRTSKPSGPKLIIRIPLCSRCAAQGSLEPDRIDHENRRMRFLVHAKFKEQLSVHRNR